MGGLWNEIRRRVLPNEIKKEELHIGDHIYTWTRANTKDHGIYVGEGMVIRYICCDHFHCVVSSHLDNFLSGRELYLFKYGVCPALFLTKLGGGTTLASTDTAEVVRNRASNFLPINNNDSGDYYRFINNGEDFAMYCKTGFLVIDNINFSRSWHIAFFLALTLAVFLSLKQLTAATFTGVAATCFGLYCIYSFGSDIGARPNVIKVDKVETLPELAKKLSSTASGFQPIQSLIDLFIVLLMARFNVRLLLRVLQSKPLQLRSETLRGVWTLAWIIFFYWAVLQRRLLSNKIHKKQLKHGDHIYTWKRNSTYAHHGIYVGGAHNREVINLVRGEDPILPSSSSSRSSEIPLSNLPKGCREEYCSLDDFLDGGELYLYKYGVSLAFFIAKTRGGTCTLGSPPDNEPNTVRNRLQELSQNGSGIGSYNLFNNNCEDFAIYCKTGLRPRKIINFNLIASYFVVSWQTSYIGVRNLFNFNIGRNGQIASIFGVFCAIIIFKSTFLPSNLIDAAATVYYIYSMFRFVADSTQCGKVYKVGLKILPRWRHGRFPLKFEFSRLEDRDLIF